MKPTNGRNTRGPNRTGEARRGGNFGRSDAGRPGRSFTRGQDDGGRRDSGEGRGPDRNRDDRRSFSAGRPGEERRGPGSGPGYRGGRTAASRDSFRGGTRRNSGNDWAPSQRQRPGQSRRQQPGESSQRQRPGELSQREPRRYEADVAPARSVDEQTVSEIIVGRHPVLEALKAERPLNKLLVAESAEGGSLTEILGKAKALGIVIQTVPRSHLNMLSQGHQGVVAYVAAHEYVGLEEIMARSTGQPPLVVLLDGVTDPNNLGAVLRTAEAAGAQGVVIPKRRAVQLTDVVAKTAAGALEYVPVARVSNLIQAMEQLKQAGYWIAGTDVEGTQVYTQVDYKGPTAVVIGSEGQGLSRLIKENCDYLVRIPMLGQLQSLNASVAAGVLLYEAVRQRS